MMAFIAGLVIGSMLGANRERLKSLAKRHRDRFPRRYGRGDAI